MRLKRRALGGVAQRMSVSAPLSMLSSGIFLIELLQNALNLEDATHKE